MITAFFAKFQRKEVFPLRNAKKLLAFVLGLTTASLWGYKIPLLCSFLTGVAGIACAALLKPIPIKKEGFQDRKSTRLNSSHTS